MTPRRTTNLDPKGKGDKSMSEKRGTAEGVYAVAPQRLSDMAKAGIAWTPMTSGGISHSSVARLYTDAIRSHGFGFRSWYALTDGRCAVSAIKDMSGEPKSL
jgi:hypothetical protein